MDATIEVDAEVWALLRAHAEPFTDTPNSVLRRLLGLEGAAERAMAERKPVQATAVGGSAGARSKSRGKGGSKTVSSRTRTRVPSGSLLPEERYIEPLLRALDDAGGRAPYREVVDAVGQILHDDLTDLDRGTLSSGAIRWQSRLQFVRLRLIERGYLDRDTPRGVWGISDAGREALAKGDL